MSRRIGGHTTGNRKAFDSYPTDSRWVDALLRSHQPNGPIWEPAAGAGDIVQVLETNGYNVRATDIQTGTDFLTCQDQWQGSVITNPPYSLTTEFITKALELATDSVALLLPMQFLGGQERYRNIYSVRPPSLVVVVPSRMKVHGKSSQFYHAWYCWFGGVADGTRVVWEPVA